jgi:signal transduction histidine kinase
VTLPKKQSSIPAALQFLRLEQRERRQLSQRLHDDLQQMLVASKMVLQKYALSHLEDDLKEAIDILDQTLIQTRDLTVELSPPLLFKSGLQTAFEWLIPWMHDRQKLKLQVVVTGNQKPVAEEIGHFLLWSAKQILLDGAKSGGREARIDLEFSEKGLEIRIRQNSTVSPQMPGLAEIKERIAMLEGEFHFKSAPEGSAEFKILLPPETLFTSVV